MCVCVSTFETFSEGRATAACLAGHSNAGLRERKKKREEKKSRVGAHLNQGISEHILSRFVESVYHTLIIDDDGSNDQIVDHLLHEHVCGQSTNIKTNC